MLGPQERWVPAVRAGIRSPAARGAVRPSAV